ncbi:2OG-Fe(II) oxygenase [Halieaceae bacterium IMCC8485]|uniref:2OG-Fe(II) oxygenase n=1 Tax=Candidatus Seongchinamella marina TaxID=2518990 RepID=A0ABT3SWE3_9GAMM|nr:2OG-Fe(II) oxygenase family protein [Candidatus Seongchinamella marina]MCX2973619.1 2OG-Fe(II) oxygenase [Candidatus Seongchinamella marina]
MRLAANAVNWAGRFSQRGRIQVPGLFDDASAEQLHRCLVNQDQWNLAFNRRGEHVDIGSDSVSIWTEAQSRQFEEMIYAGAKEGFQYRYKAVPIYDVYHDGSLPGHFFNTLFEFLNSDAFLNFGRQLLGRPEIGFCDAQATCFEAGHFLTTHDDDIGGKNRVAAYVISMTKNWNPNWGGALQFFNEQGNIEEGFLPAFNTLNVFQIPQSHAVEFVTPFASGPRLSITGWFRTGKDPRS